MAHPVGAVSTGLTTVEEVDTAEAATMITIVDPLDMMIENAAHTDEETITAPVVSTGMLLQVAMIVIVAEGTIVVAAMTTTAETVGVLIIMLGMASQCRLEIIGIRMAEVEPLTAVLMIGTPVDRSLSANLLRCGPLRQIKPVCYSRAPDCQRLSIEAV